MKMKGFRMVLIGLLLCCLAMAPGTGRGEELPVEIGGGCIDDMPHEPEDPRIAEENPATCEKAGRRVVVITCSVCGAELSRETEETPATGHDWGEWRVSRITDCETAGEETRVCARDSSHTETRTSAAPGHAWGEWILSKMATCETAGRENRFCARNEHHFESRVIPAKGHYWGEWETVTPATLEQEGKERRVCKRNPEHVETRTLEKVPGLALTGKTSVDLTGLMRWDGDINRKDPVILVNGKKLSELSDEERSLLQNNRETMVFLLALCGDPGNAEIPDALTLGSLEIRVDRNRLAGLVGEAKKRQEGRDNPIIYKAEEETRNPEQEAVQETLRQATADMRNTWNEYQAQNQEVRITVVFRPEEEKVKFEEKKTESAQPETKTFETSEPEPKKKKKCLTPETLILLADGSEKRVDELETSDRLMAWDFDRGCLTSAPLTFFHRVEEEAPALRVSFSDGTELGIVGEHVLFDLTDRQFVAISEAGQEETLKGHRFAKLAEGQMTEVELTGIREDGTAGAYYSPVTEAHFNCFANGMLNISGFMEGFYNVFDLEEDELKYDAAQKAADWAAMGDLPEELYEALVSQELLARNNVGWLSVSIGKGLISAEELYELFDFCGPFFVGNGPAE